MSSIESDIDSNRQHLAPPRAMIRPLVILLLSVAVVLGGVYGWHLFMGNMMKKYMGAAASAPQTVSTAIAVKSSWQSQTQAIGSLRAVRGADLAAQASGIVDEIRFQSGSEVPAGAVLLRLRLNDDPAKLEQLQAAAALADQTLKRDQEQFKAEAISQAVIDNDVSSLKSARAQVAAQQALIDEKTVRAPFAGKLGIRQIDEGQYLNAGTAVVTLQALDPILVDFYLPQQDLASIKAGQKAYATVDTFPNERFTGTIESVNSKVDTASRNVQVRASFANADHRLLPGMYAKVAVDKGDAVDRITLPQSAITYNPYGDTVFVVEKKDVDGKSVRTVTQRFVTLGATRGDQVAILKGIAEGEEVVTGGQMKLRNGVPVTVNNAVTPTDEVQPTPPNE